MTRWERAKFSVHLHFIIIFELVRKLHQYQFFNYVRCHQKYMYDRYVGLKLCARRSIERAQLEWSGVECFSMQTNM